MKAKRKVKGAVIEAARAKRAAGRDQQVADRHVLALATAQAQQEELRQHERERAEQAHAEWHRHV